MTSVFTPSILLGKVFDFQQNLTDLMRKVTGLSRDLTNKLQAGNEQQNFSAISDEEQRELAKRISAKEDFDIHDIPKQKIQSDNPESVVLEVIHSHFSNPDKVTKKNLGKKRVNAINLILTRLGKANSQFNECAHANALKAIKALKPDDGSANIFEGVTGPKNAILQGSIIWQDLLEFAKGGKELESTRWHAQISQYPLAMIDLCMGTIGRYVDSKPIKHYAIDAWKRDEKISTAVKAIVHFANLVE